MRASLGPSALASCLTLLGGCGLLLDVDAYRTVDAGTTSTGSGGGSMSCEPAKVAVQQFTTAQGTGFGGRVVFTPDGKVVTAGHEGGGDIEFKGGQLVTGSHGLYIAKLDVDQWSSSHPTLWTSSLDVDNAENTPADVDNESAGALAVGVNGTTLLSATVTKSKSSLGALQDGATQTDHVAAVYGMINSDGTPRWLKRFESSEDLEFARAVLDAQERPFIAFQSSASVALGGKCGEAKDAGTILAELSPSDGACVAFSVLPTANVTLLDLAYSRSDDTLVLVGENGPGSKFVGYSTLNNLFVLKLDTSFKATWPTGSSEAASPVLFPVGPGAFNRLDNDEPLHVAIDDKGDIFLAAAFGRAGAGTEITFGDKTEVANPGAVFLAKIGSDGGLSWHQVYPASGLVHVTGFGASGGRLAMVGNLENGPADGNMTVGTSEVDFGDGPLVGSNNGPGDIDAFATVWSDTDCGPVRVFSQRFGDAQNSSEQRINGVAVSPSGRVVLSGSRFGEVQIKPGPDGSIPNEGGGERVFLLGLWP